MVEKCSLNQLLGQTPRLVDSISFFKLGIYEYCCGYQQSRQIVGQDFINNGR